MRRAVVRTTQPDYETLEDPRFAPPTIDASIAQRTVPASPLPLRPYAPLIIHAALTGMLSTPEQTLAALGLAAPIDP